MDPGPTFFTFLTFSIPCGRRLAQPEQSMWAYLPVGPLERQLREGIQGGFREGVQKNPQERVVALLWWDIMGKPLLITY